MHELPAAPVGEAGDAAEGPAGFQGPQQLATWRKIHRGLPAGDLGRISIAVSPARAGRVWATAEAKRTALYRSEDRGETWTEVNDSSAVTGRPFYFSHMVADPRSPDRLYKPAYLLQVSDDAGKTFSPLGISSSFGASYHGDVHAVWVNPRNTEQVVIGTDGGVYVSHDRGRRWRFVSNLPLSQFYHVSVDDQWPYNVYGGLQDNATWYGPSRRSGPVGNKHWNAVIPGDGFWAFPDLQDPDVLYGEFQGGRLFRVRKSTGETRDIRPARAAGEPRHRYNWNTPLHLSRRNPGTLYYGAQFLFRSTDRGESWERISPDLTTDDPAKQRQEESGGLSPDNSTAENHCTLFAISESPKDAGVVWVGTDDGRVQLTRDGGKTWTSVEANVAGLPRGTWVSSLEASPFDPATAFATFDGHMTGDTNTYVYRTTDYGRSWTSLGSPSLKWHAHVVKQDPVNPELLFLGTEWGLYLSLDGGKHWAQFTARLPNVPVRDLAIHPRDHDLVIATHGRGIFILDDLTPLRQLTAEVLESDVAFLESRPSPMVAPAFEFGFSGDTEFEGRSPAEAAYVTYYLEKRHMFGDLRLEIRDPSGALVSTIPGGKRRGLNRVEWPMRGAAPRLPPGAGFIPSLFTLLGPRVLEGTYSVKMIKGKASYSSEIRLVPDPRSTHTAEDRAFQRETTLKLHALCERLASLVDATVALGDEARARAGALPAKDGLRRRLEALAAALESQRSALASTSRGEGISGEEKLREELGMLYGNVNGYEGRPTRSQLDSMEVLGGELEAVVRGFEALAAKELPALNAALAKKGAPPLEARRP